MPFSDEEFHTSETDEQQDDSNEDIESSDSESEFDKNDNKSVPEGSNSDSERSNIRSELKSMSFEELMKLKEKLGSKVYNEAIFGTTKAKNTIKKVFKRVNANRPMEMSSKKQVPFGLNSKKKIDQMIVDPRFNAKCGDFDSTKFKKKYEFVNDLRETELKTLKASLKNCADSEEATRIKFLIQRLKNQLHEEKKRKDKIVEKCKESEVIDKERKQNKNSFYVKPNIKKTEEMIIQYEELKKSGKLQKHLEKRRKKSIIKDRKKINIH